MNLNNQQQHCVSHYGAPQVIIAGAGTGKTTVMIEKIKHLIQTNQHEANQILALTFTNKAANEMKERFDKTSSSILKPTFGTFHSFCLRLLKTALTNQDHILKSNFTIIDNQQQKEIINELMKNQPNPLNRKPKDILSKISRIKQTPREMHPELLEKSATDIRTIFKPYNEKLKQLNCVDFDDLLLYSYDILLADIKTLEQLQNKYKYIIVDEYQDTNQIQNDLTILLAKAHENICVVGDFDQTIYSWRGAKVENLLEFHHHFPNAVVHKLESNYRSTNEILKTANQLIEFNSQREPKKLIGQRASNNKPQHIVCFNEREEADTIARKIKSLLSKEYKPNDFAVLYRTNQQARVIEESLTHHNIPHQIIGTTAFYQRSEIKHAIAFLQCLDNINQPVWFERAILNPPRGVGKTSIKKLIDFSLEKKLSLELAITDPNCPIQDRYRTITQNFISDIHHINQQNIPIETKLEKLFESVNFSSFLRKQENSLDRLDNIKELQSKLKNITNLHDFLDEITLFQANDATETTEKVSCLTLHLAKGLEFPIVFIPGFESHLMPLKNAESIEEERRLAYVGITRGKDQVYLLSTYKRSLMGEDWYHDPSPFTKEISDTISLVMTEEANLLGKALVFKLNDANITFKIIRKTTKKTLNATTISSQIFEPGDIVTHPNLGTGVVESTSGEGDGRMYDINFHSGRKKLMAKFAPLSKKA